MNYLHKYEKYKNKYLDQIGGRQALINIGGVDFQGADVLIINNYKGNDTIVLFTQRNAMGIYAQLPGGRCEDTHNGLEETASLELYEESKKSIKISIDIFKNMTRDRKYVDYDGGSRGLFGKRRCFICRVPKISRTIFNNNAKILRKLINPRNPRFNISLPGKLRKYMETYDMVRIPINNIISKIIPGDDGRGREITDIDGNNIFVAKFAMTAFIKAYNKSLITNPYNLIHMGENDNDNVYTDPLRRLQGRIDEY